jgi:hypothetical protein
MLSFVGVDFPVASTVESTVARAQRAVLAFYHVHPMQVLQAVVPSELIPLEGLRAIAGFMKSSDIDRTFMSAERCLAMRQIPL